MTEPIPGRCAEQYSRVNAESNRDIDILFVIDNSGSMAEEQDSLASNFQRFIDVLEDVDGGLPNLHIGVISTDVGTGSYYVPGCHAGGDQGRLQATPRLDGCPIPANAFIEDIARPDGTRERNYQGDLAEVFSCIARLGTEGCNFEQPLESMRQALDGDNPANEGFLRYRSFLVVVIISDEDDCSTADNSMYAQPESTESDPLGTLSSFRCFDFGVACEPDHPRQTGLKTDCTPRDDSPFLYDVDEYASFLKGLKRDPSMVLVAAIIGDQGPVVVGRGDSGLLRLEPSCVSAAGSAVPAIRTQHFLDQFPERSTLTTICNDDLTEALTLIAEEVSQVVGDACIEGDIDEEPEVDGIQHECLVSDIRFLNQPNEEETILPECAEMPPSPGEMPCWYLQQDFQACPGTQTGALIRVERGGRSVPLDTDLVIRCAAGCSIH